MITLGGIALPDGTGNGPCGNGENFGKIAWTDRDAYTPVLGRTARTIGGNVHYAEALVSAGRPITLEAAEGLCWLSLAQKDAIVALGSTLGTVAFVYETETYTCVFDRENGATAFRRKRPTSDEYWYGIIRLLTVGTP